jgi:hypothetical protein
MNYVRTLLIITIFLFRADHLYTAEPLLAAQSNDVQQPLDINEIDSLLNTYAATETNTAPVEEKNTLDTWNEHLDLLTIKGEYWDAANDIPLDSWKDTAFDIAEKMVKKDTSLAETLKTDFFNAISKKVFLETKSILLDGTPAFQLTKEFKQMVDNAIKPPVIEIPQETKQSAPQPTIPDIVAPDPVVVSEPVPLPQPEATTTSQDATTSTDQPAEQTVESLQQKWREQLERIKTEGKSSFATFEILSGIHQAAQDLLKTDQVKESDLQHEFLDALQARAVAGGKNLSPLNIPQEIMNFNNAIGLFNPADQYAYLPQSYPPQQLMVAQNKAQSQQEFAAQQSQLEDQLKKLEQQQQEDKEKNMIELKALIQAQEEGKRTKQELHASIQEQKEREAVLAKKHAELEAEMQTVRAQYAQQLAAAQKPVVPEPAAAKGIFSAITDPLYNWWYGTNPEQATAAIPRPSRSPEQEDVLNAMVANTADKNAAKAVLAEFDDLLLNFKSPEYWDAQHKRPNDRWIGKMRPIVKDIVLHHKIMLLPAIAEIVEQTLTASKAMSEKNIQRTIVEIKTLVQEVYAQEQRQKDAEEQRAQLKRDRKEQKLLAQQRAKDEQDRILAEEKRKIQLVASYKDQKKKWYDLLSGIGQRKDVTDQDNHQLTQEALEKSQSLLQLAGEIPHKNKTALSQKLKQKFSVALLDQQRNNDNTVNIHRNIDTFNQNINKIIE